jgi:Kef-type K+ transport system membrane component KefB
MNMANSANPVIARILMDLGLLKGPIGALIMSATIVDDLVNWTLFAIILNDIAPSGAATGGSLLTNMALVGLLFVVVLGLGRRIGPLALRRIQTHVASTSGVIALIALLVLLVSSASEALGVPAFLGAFLIGVALGDASERQRAAHHVIGQVVTSFAPIYFVSMGMATNFIANFDPVLVALILVVACISKVGAVLAGAKAAGMPLDREAWAIGFGLNARGATGIILAGVGLASGVIDARIFVAIVVMALVTSLMAGPMMSHLLWRAEAMRMQHVRPAMERE